MTAVLAEAGETTFVAGTPRLIEAVAAALAEGRALDNRALTALADEAFGGTRARGTYGVRDAYDALEAGVLVHLERSGLTREGWASPDPAAFIRERLRPVLSLLPRQSGRDREQELYQQFSTPPAHAYLAARALAPRPGSVVLEPSCGTGSLAVWVRAAGARVVCNEISGRRRAILEHLGFETHDVDAEFLDDLLGEEVQPDDTLMNPPFTSSGGRVSRNSAEFGSRHVETSLRRTGEGGRLVSLAAASMAIGRARADKWWRKIAASYRVRAAVELPGEEYARYGTDFDNLIMVIDKTGPAGSWEEAVAGARRGRAESLEQAWEWLAEVSAERRAF